MANAPALIVYPVKDLTKAKQFFSAFLGTEPYADSPYYVGYRTGDREVGLDPNGTAVVAYIDVTDIAAALRTLQNAGGTVIMEPKDVAKGLMIAQVALEDNVLGLRQQPK